MAERILTLNERIQAMLAEERTTKLSLAVLLHDDFAAGKQAMGNIKVSLEELGQQSIRNLSGHYLFMDVEAGTYTILVTSDHYLEEQEEVTLPLSDPDNPDPDELIVSIALQPLPSYPFPPGTTLVKGVVKDTEGQPISGATVEVLGKQMETQTTGKGELVLYFTGLEEDDIIIKDGKRLVKGNGNENMRFRATHDDYKTEQVQDEVEECKTTSVFITMQPK